MLSSFRDSSYDADSTTNDMLQPHLSSSGSGIMYPPPPAPPHLSSAEDFGAAGWGDLDDYALEPAEEDSSGDEPQSHSQQQPGHFGQVGETGMGGFFS